VELGRAQLALHQLVVLKQEAPVKEVRQQLGQELQQALDKEAGLLLVEIKEELREVLLQLVALDRVLLPHNLMEPLQELELDRVQLVLHQLVAPQQLAQAKEMQPLLDQHKLQALDKEVELLLVETKEELR